MKEYLKMLKNMFRFDGRARRREYWVVNVINTGICCLLYALLFFTCTVVGDPLCYNTGSAVGFHTSGSTVGTIMAIPLTFVSLYLFISTIGLTVRRYHDIGFPGWVYPICLVGTCLCGIGAIVHLVFTFLPSREDNKYGPNPKAPENNEYEDVSGIIIGSVTFAICFFVLIVSVVLNIAKCGLKDHVAGANLFDNKGNTTESVMIDEEFDLTTQEETEDLSTEDMLTEETDDTNSTGDSIDNSDPANYTDKYTLKVGGVNLQVDFDGGCTVTDYDGLLNVYREYDNGQSMNLDLSDSYVDVGDTSGMTQDDFYSDIDGYTLLEKEDAKSFSVNGCTGYVSYCTYNTEYGVLATGSIWQDIGASTYLKIDFYTDATTDTDAIIESSVITLN